MKKNSKNMVKTNEVRVEIKEQKGSVCQVIKGLYSYKCEETKKLNKILPANSKDLCAIAARLCKEIGVGEIIRDKEGNARLNSKGEERVQKFTQASLISWLIKNQKELKNILKEEAAKRAEKEAAAKVEETPAQVDEPVAEIKPAKDAKNAA